MTASPPSDTIAKIDAEFNRLAREPELRAALDNIERLLRRHETIAGILLRGRMKKAWIIAEGAMQ